MAFTTNYHSNFMYFFTFDELDAYEAIVGQPVTQIPHGQVVVDALLAQLDRQLRQLDPAVLQYEMVRPAVAPDCYPRSLDYRIFRHTDAGRGVFFRFRVDFREQSFHLELDCQRKKDGLSGLTAKQIARFNQITGGKKASSSFLLFGEAAATGWGAIYTEIAQFILAHLASYDAAIRYVWSKDVLPSTQLFEVLPPNGSLPPATRTPRFRGTERDELLRQWLDANQAESGIDLVLEHERQRLSAAGQAKAAGQVARVPDGEGYALRSWELDGQTPRFIAVKVTTLGADALFHLSTTERAFMVANSAHYHLYRLYSYNSRLHTAWFFVINGDLTDRYAIEPMRYQVQPC